LERRVADLFPAELSGGMQKRVGLARAIATQPEIIFFDEPTTGLDPIMADVINDLIVKCVKDLGATALSITHDMASARKIADRVAMIYKGKIIWSGPVSQIDNSGNPYVDQFIHGRADGPIQMEVSQSRTGTRKDLAERADAVLPCGCRPGPAPGIPVLFTLNKPCPDKHRSHRLAIRSEKIR
jgi:ABC-type transporter Mla maintaining outer membrane lipid asymmetry ATPase subunit MlaF